MTEAVTGAVLTIMKSRDEIDLHMASARLRHSLPAANPFSRSLGSIHVSGDWGMVGWSRLLLPLM